ncbi:MAG: glycosyltransferase family 39 protein [Actinobacteria bacterium]|nr:glycosyltransferase family 39 protein [Actinomycetota bacterium]
MLTPNDKKTDKKFVLFAITLAILHFIFLSFFFEPAISTPDAQGYFTQGRIMATEGKTYLEPKSVLQYIGPHWHSLDNEKYYTTFPPGFPFIIAIVYKIFGTSATLWINPILASLLLFIFFLFCKSWLSGSWSLLAMFLLAINPFYNEHALFGDSHILLIFFFISSLLVFHKVKKNNSKLFAFLSGILIGIVPTIRYAEFVFCTVFALYGLSLFKFKKISFTTLLLFGMGMCIPLGTMAIRNQITYGKFWVTGYSLSETPALFSLSYLLKNFVPFIMMLLTMGLAILFPLGIAGFVKLIKNIETKLEGIFFTALLILLTLTYMSYYWQPDPQSMRFLLPTFPLYTLSATYFLSSITKDKLKWTVLAVTLLITLPWGILSSLTPLKHLKQQNKILSTITCSINKSIEPGSVIVVNEGICQNLDISDKWKLIDISILRQSDITLKNTPQKPIRNNKTAKIYNNLYGQAFKKQFVQDLRMWNTENNPVYIIAYDKEIKKFKQTLLNGENISEVDEIALPLPSDFKEMENRRQLILNSEQKRPTISLTAQERNQIFDFIIKKEPLKIIKWTIDIRELNSR